MSVIRQLFKLFSNAIDSSELFLLVGSLLKSMLTIAAQVGKQRGLL